MIFDNWDTPQKYAGFFLFEVVLWTAVLGFGFWLGFPGNGLFVGLIALANIVIGIAGWYITKEDAGFTGYRATRKDQLSSEEAEELAWFWIRRREGYRVDKKIGTGDVPEKSDFEDKDEARRLYKFEFSPLNVSGRACLYMALDQELAVDVDDIQSLKDAAGEIRSTRFVRSWQVPEYEERKKLAREKLGMTSTPEVLLDTGDGEAENVRVVAPRNVSQGGGSSDDD